MPATKKKPKKPVPAANGAQPPAGSEVLTLAETAAYLRLPESEVIQLIQSQDLPGRQSVSGWRFLKSAIQAWLSGLPRTSSKQALLGMAGRFKDDPFLDDIVKEAYRQRGRPITEDGE